MFPVSKGTKNGREFDKDRVLDYVSHKADLTGRSKTYQILMNENPLYQWDGRRPGRSSVLMPHTIYWGGYVKKLTEAKIQEELDYIRDG